MKREKTYMLLRNLLSIFLFPLLFVGLAAQSFADTSGDNSALKEKLRQEVLGSAAAAQVGEEYVVGYRDILHVSVYGEGSMDVGSGIQAEPTGQSLGGAAPAEDFIRGRGAGVEVRLDGRISLRHIGDVAVVGMNLTQISNYLKKLYSTIYSNPEMTVTLVQSNSLQYTVMGQVTTPGLYHLDFPITVVRAVARAGGFTEWAKSTITIIRPEQEGSSEKGKGKTFKFDFSDFLKGKDLDRNIFIQSGDVIVVH